MIENWNQLMEQEMKKGYLEDIRDKLDEAYKTKAIYPEKQNLFRALDLTPLNQVKVVILGQDPYHGKGQAQGLAFSVPDSIRIPPSLQNIYKELSMEYNRPVLRTGNLEDWAKEGVLLLNPILSVEEGKPLSHKDLGWQQFTDEILKTLDQQEQPIVFLLWGAQARKAAGLLSNPNHLILESPHPSPFSANRGFFGNNHFRAANEYLESHGLQGIDWTRPTLPESHEAS